MTPDVIIYSTAISACDAHVINHTAGIRLAMRGSNTDSQYHVMTASADMLPNDMGPMSSLITQPSALARPMSSFASQESGS